MNPNASLAADPLKAASLSDSHPYSHIRLMPFYLSALEHLLLPAGLCPPRRTRILPPRRKTTTVPEVWSSEPITDVIKYHLQVTFNTKVAPTPHFVGSPFDYIPLEIQVEIFSHCLTDGNYPDIDDDSSPPLILAQVCSSWHSVIISTPRLWSTFQIAIGSTSSHRRIQRTMNNLELWLQRSRCYPLSLRVTCEHQPSPGSMDVPSTVTEVINRLLVEVRRWKHADLDVPASSIIASLESEGSLDSLPMLRTLALQAKGLAGTTAATAMARGGIIGGISLAIPWAQLTELELLQPSDALPSLDGCLEILAAAPRLRHCSVNAQPRLSSWAEWSDTSTSISNIPSRIVLPSLNSFHLRIQNRLTVGPDPLAVLGSNHLQEEALPEVNLSRFLSLLSLPSLHDFQIRWLLPWKSEEASELAEQRRLWQDSFADFLGRSAGTLESLTLAYLPLSEKNLVEVISVPVGLKHLDLRYSLNDEENDPIGEAFIQALTLSEKDGDGEGRLLPGLASVHLECHGERFGTDSLTKMIESRLVRRAEAGASVPTKMIQVDGKWKRGHTFPTRSLKTFHMLSMNPVSEMLRERLKAWRGDGMDASFDSLLIY